MNLSELFLLQEKLDDLIAEERGLWGRDLLDKRILALRVELGELANELPEVFKFWSHKKNNYEKALVEYIDCLHFILSLGLEMNVSSCLEMEDRFKARKDITSQFNEMFLSIGDFEVNVRMGNESAAIDQYNDMFLLFIILGEMLGFTWEQIEQTYFDKNKINHERQENGY